ncbi:ankyrin repeat domain-containing protein [Cardinium endosymbiont of Nabis limbatus]|uniref:ankyrin repeat domain-containing protein n=1 Tax=Cardinium endosymbiont of Nabis limbatus TaxID=3066217 RepID=UPI003AF3EA15
MYDGNRWFRLMIICIGSLLFTTACSKLGVVNLKCDLDDLDYEKLNNGAIRQRDFSTMDWSKVDWSKVDLLKVNDQQTLFCKVIEARARSDLLEALLEHIKCNPEKYPPKKVLYLIAGYVSDDTRLVGMNIKMPLLMRAVIKGHLDDSDIALHMLKLLFTTLYQYKYGLDACAEAFYQPFGPGKYTIMHAAVESGNVKIVSYLIDIFSQIKKTQGKPQPSIPNHLVGILNIENSAKSTPLGLAFQAYAFLHDPNILKIIQCLLKHIDALFQIEFQSLLLLRDLAEHSDSDQVKKILRYNDPFLQIASQSALPLHALAERGDSDRLKNMLDAIREALEKINRFEYKKMMEEIVNLKGECDRTLLYYTVICEAASSSKSDTIEYLMELGASCTQADKHEISPLFIAIAFGALDIVNLLLDKKFSGNVSLQSDINRQGYAGLTPLNFAVWCKEKVVISVISKLFDTYIKYYNRGVHYKPVNDAALIGKVDARIVQALLNAGADLSIPNEVGEGPFGKAIKNKNFQIQELLLNVGADSLAATHFDDFLKHVPAKPFSKLYRGRVIWIFTLMLQRAIRSTQVVGVKSNQCDLMDLYMDCQSVYKYGAYKGQRKPLQYLLASLLQDYGISTKIMAECNSKKRPFDADGCAIVDTKCKRKGIQSCDGSSGRSHAT